MFHVKRRTARDARRPRPHGARGGAPRAAAPGRSPAHCVGMPMREATEASICEIWSFCADEAA
jgi:hypothetical protein